MNHKKIENKFLLFLDGDLDINTQEIVISHLSTCNACKTRLDLIRNIWKDKPSRAIVPPHQWTKIKNRIDSENKDDIVDFGIFPQLNLVLRSVVYSVLIIIAIFLGNLFSRYAILNNSVNSHQESKNQVIKDFFLDRLDPIPPESIGKLTLFSNNISGEKR